MKIDCDSDGRVSWDELLTFVVSQDRNQAKPDHSASILVREDIPECIAIEAHRDVAECEFEVGRKMRTPTTGHVLYLKAGEAGVGPEPSDRTTGWGVDQGALLTPAGGLSRYATLIDSARGMLI